ncbi:MAG: class I SAM-dependent methyltransferase [Phycisphaerales bacterium]|nr:class I SAM-dependent methyltransferase [Phycisphaerales bacterium]
MPESWTQPDEALVKVVSTLAPGHALDVGCGGGHDTLWLARQGWSVTAIDLSRHAVSKVRKLARETKLDVTAARDDVTALDAEQEFDLVSICYMHLPAADRSKMLTNVTRALKVGGTLLFRSFEASIDDAPFDRSLLPSREAVLAELDAGFKIRQADVLDEFFSYMKKQMRLLTIVAIRAK